MEAITNEQLAALPITLLQPTFENSSKAKALQYAISAISLQPSAFYDYVVILDADNIVAIDFLSQLSQIVRPNIAIQCHRTAKNTNNDIAALDGLSEEINNSIFRRGHNRIGMSSALIGSGMCFDYNWFKDNVTKLNTAVEDRELEALLMKQGTYIHYEEDIHVLDEKVSDSGNFQRQRLRWMTGQVQALYQMLPYIPKAIITGNINYIDKTIQQALIPRSILLALIPLLCVIATTSSYIFHLPSSIFHLKWWCLFVALCIALYLAIPKQMHKQSLFNNPISLLTLAWKMIINITKIDHTNKEFIHTTHDK
jgi:cellulose synthase/poly-beta-1,6-N-acetylglucosamine synthase-like glycosyltransferase